MTRPVRRGLAAAVLVTAAACRPATPDGQVPRPSTAPSPPAATVRAPDPRVREVTVAAGPGRLVVGFAVPAATPADRYVVRADPGGPTVVTHARRAVLTGLDPGVGYEVTVTAWAGLRTVGTAQAPTPVRPTAPVSYRVPVGDDHVVVAQSVSFHPSPGTNTSWRPATHDVDLPGRGVPAGREWQLLWLRASGCDGGARPVTFTVAASDGSLRAFLHPDGPSRDAGAVAVGPGDARVWVGDPRAPVVLAAGERVGARWYGMAGGSEGRCDWQLAALERPAGARDDGGAVGDAAAARRQLLYRSGTASDRGRYVTRVAAPADTAWRLDEVAVRSCVAGTVELLLVSPHGMAFGALPLDPRGTARVAVGAGRWRTWTAPPGGLLVPPGFGVGARVLGDGGAEAGRCVLKAFGSAVPVGG